MKKFLCLIFALCFVLGLSACSNKSQVIQITLPAKSAQSVIFYEKEFTATKNKLKLSCDGIEQAEVLLDPENDTLTGFITQTVTSEKSAKADAKKGEQFRIGIVSQNTSDTPVVITLKIKNIEFK